jgi:RimJ/RimL family protein N-acetyltransferase
MLYADLFRGQLVRLAMIDVDSMATAISRWSRDAVYTRLANSDVARAWSPFITREWIEKEALGEKLDMHWFGIHTLADDRLIGGIDLSAVHNGHGESFVGVGIGERDFWGKGYGREAMRLVLRYAFTELNFERVSLDVFEYNPRAIRSYEKVGFRHEGRERGLLHREGRRWDLIYMGILRSEWEAQQKNT